MFLKEILEKVNFEKSQPTTKKIMGNYPACKELRLFSQNSGGQFIFIIGCDTFCNLCKIVNFKFSKRCFSGQFQNEIGEKDENIYIYL